MFKQLTVLLSCFYLLSGTAVKGQLLLGDTVKVAAVKLKIKQFTAEDFIRSTQKDTSFYRAFKNLKIFPHQEKSAVKVFKKNGEGKASLLRKSTHHNENSLAWIVINNEKTTGKFYNRKGEHNYFTGEMFDRVFFFKDTVFASNIVENPYQQQQPVEKGKIEKYYEQLKAFMFSPGKKVDNVPFIGYKLDIYGEKMRPYYDYTLEKVYYQDSIPCYLFSTKRKTDVKERKVVIQYLDTYYDRRTMKVIARKYHIKDSNLAFSFDIKMEVHLQLIAEEYFPSLILYKGEWDIPFKKPERLGFKIKTTLL